MMIISSISSNHLRSPQIHQILMASLNRRFSFRQLRFCTCKFETLVCRFSFAFARLLAYLIELIATNVPAHLASSSIPAQHRVSEPPTRPFHVSLR